MEKNGLLDDCTQWRTRHLILIVWYLIYFVKHKRLCSLFRIVVLFEDITENWVVIPVKIYWPHTHIWQKGHVMCPPLLKVSELYFSKILASNEEQLYYALLGVNQSCKSGKWQVIRIGRLSKDDWVMITDPTMQTVNNLGNWVIVLACLSTRSSSQILVNVLVYCAYRCYLHTDVTAWSYNPGHNLLEHPNYKMSSFQRQAWRLC